MFGAVLGPEVENRLLEVLDRGERLVHGGEAEVGDLVQLAQRAEDGEPHLIAGHLGDAGGADRLLDRLRQLGQRVLVDRTALARTPHAAHDLAPAERFGDATALDDGEGRFLDGGEAAAALRTGAPSPDDLTLVDLA